MNCRWFEPAGPVALPMAVQLQYTSRVEKTIPVRLIDSLATTEAMARIFSDESVLRAMLDFEIALARAEGELNIIPQAAADAVVKAAKVDTFDGAALAAATPPAGTPAIPFVKALTEKVAALNSGVSQYVHWGATSQDVCDTALVLLLKQAWPHLRADLERLRAALRRLAEQHKNTVMLGRTLMQPAPPVTFGLKAAGWLAAITRSGERLIRSVQMGLVLQFGGASGTLAALGQRGIAVAQALARELDLAMPDAPWHTHRDRLAGVVCDCGILLGCVGKLAQDILLLMQSEVAEVAEPSGAERGGSSTMPHKKNPVGCTVALAAVNRVPGLVASFLSCMSQEHERAAGGWQAEWKIVSDLMGATAMALSAMAEVAEGLTVSAARMRANVESTRGLIFAERAMMLLAGKLGREKAHHLLEQALRQSAEQQRRLADVLSGYPEVRDQIGAALADLEDPRQYLGSAEEFRKRLLASSENTDIERKD